MVVMAAGSLQQPRESVDGHWMLAAAKRKMQKQPRIDGFFKRKHTEISEVISYVHDSNIETVASENHYGSPRIETIDNEIDHSSLERDPGLRPQIWNVNQRDEIRRAYINAGPYQPILSKSPKSRSVTHQRSFQSSWVKLFPLWLGYSPVKDAAFCLLCYLFNKPSGHSGKNVFAFEGFQSWKKVRDGKICSFLNHEGKDPNSPHKIAEISCLNLMNQSQHIHKVIENYLPNKLQTIDHDLRQQLKQSGGLHSKDVLLEAMMKKRIQSIVEIFFKC
ncbi:hypothetical protein L3X38_030921 [Prunus dulcis]|uniref:TTF-type domain-containing protein n=1 Tax=Prunus dulcis TaxID=3755 RepID=A0AAD4YUH0_PRUDU|nr:hypothetical protein L3X38_030921 [Prunus dulcis]